MSASALSRHFARSNQVSRDQSVWQPGDPAQTVISGYFMGLTKRSIEVA
jgi:hypothetical protein